jgi:hypothetical protein
MQDPQHVPSGAGDPEFAAVERAAADVAGKWPLTDDELLLLGGETLARTYTRDEKQYR